MENIYLSTYLNGVIMKKLFTLILLAAAFTTMVTAQVNYQLQSGSTPFSYISGASAFTWSGSSDDGYTAATPIGFTFNYCGTDFTEFQASTNGFIRLGSGLTTSLSANTLTGSNRSIIAPLWDDHAVLDSSADVTYVVTGTAPNRALTVQWKNVKWRYQNTAPNAEFQVKLFEGTNTIVFHYGVITASTSTPTASIGLVNNTVLTSTTNPVTNTFLSVNIGGLPDAPVYHQSMGYAFNSISVAPDTNAYLTFVPVTPTPIAGGTYVIGPLNQFKSLSEAAMALNIHGIAGPVVIELPAGTYDDIFHLTDVPGVSAVNTITFRAISGNVAILTPLNGSGTSSTTAQATSDAMVRLDGTSHVLVQGLNFINNQQTTNGLKFESAFFVGNSVNPDGTMRNGARFNTFFDLYIDMKSTAGANVTGATGFRYFTTSSTEVDTGKATSYNTISNCTILGFWRAGWKSFGISGRNPDRGNVIRNCTMGTVDVPTGSGSDVRAVEADCQRDLTIANNTIKDISVAIMTTNNIYGIWLNPASSATNLNSGTINIHGNLIMNLLNTGTTTTSGFAIGIASNNVDTNTVFNIYNNKISNVFSNGSTTARAVGIGLYMSTVPNVVVNMYNNMVSNLRAPRATSNPSVRGIDLQNAGGNGRFNVYNNSSYLNNDVPPTIAAHYSTNMYWANFGTGTLDLRNNILVNTMSSQTGKSVNLYPSANSNYLRLDSTTNYNLYYVGAATDTTVGISWDAATLRKTLADHQAAVAAGGIGGPRDVKAKSKEVFFVSVNDLHLTGSSNGDTSLVGQPLAMVPMDFDGDSRSLLFPYIGADEAPIQIPVELTSFAAAVNGNTVTVTWQTATELNSNSFVIEQKLIGGEWRTEGTVKAAGTTTEPQNYSYAVQSLAAGKYQFRLKMVDNDGSFTYSNILEVAVGVPAEYALSQNYPNPFNPVTAINYALPVQGNVQLHIYATNGELVQTLVNTNQAAGNYTISFDASRLASGTYFYRIMATDVTGKTFTNTKKMLLIK